LDSGVQVSAGSSVVSQRFAKGIIIWTEQRGALAVYGLIYVKWVALGAERSPLGYPLSDELDTTKRDGRFNRFQYGAIYWKRGAREAFAVYGNIYAKYGRMGYEVGYGYPITDETVVPDKSGRFNHFEGDRSIYWQQGTNEAFTVFGLIRAKWAALGWERSGLGYPISDEGAADKGGRVSRFQNGAVYFQSGAKEAFAVYGLIYAKYGRMGYEKGYGYPITDETVVPDKSGHFNHFEGGRSIYWKQGTGEAFAVFGLIRAKWAALGWERSGLGYPISDEGAADKGGRVSRFQNGAVYFQSGAKEAFAVYGLIYAKYARMGYEKGYGYPITDETLVPDKSGRFNHFEGGRSIYWKQGTGEAFAVYGLIRDKWASLGWERSSLGYPISDEHDVRDNRSNAAVKEYRESRFERGAIRWSSQTGTVVVP